MSKEVKSQILSKVATLLDKFSDRLVRIANQTRQNTDAVAVLRDDIRLKAGRAEGIAIEANGKAERAHLALIHHGELIDSVKKENDVREDKQTLRDQNNVQSLVNLRESVQKGFDLVRNDVDTLMKQVQKLNERVGQAESKVSQFVVGSIVPSAQILDTVRRVGEIEKKLAPGMPSDHVWLNKKLTGVYDTTDELEKRLQEIEAEIELITALRVAQAAFVLGPRKTPTATSGKNEAKA